MEFFRLIVRLVVFASENREEGAHSCSETSRGKNTPSSVKKKHMFCSLSIVLWSLVLGEDSHRLIVSWRCVSLFLTADRENYGVELRSVFEQCFSAELTVVSRCLTGGDEAVHRLALRCLEVRSRKEEVLKQFLVIKSVCLFLLAKISRGPFLRVVARPFSLTLEHLAASHQFLRVYVLLEFMQDLLSFSFLFARLSSPVSATGVHCMIWV